MTTINIKDTTTFSNLHQRFIDITPERSALSSIKEFFSNLFYFFFSSKPQSLIEKEIVILNKELIMLTKVIKDICTLTTVIEETTCKLSTDIKDTTCTSSTDIKGFTRQEYFVINPEPKGYLSLKNINEFDSKDAFAFYIPHLTARIKEYNETIKELEQLSSFNRLISSNTPCETEALSTPPTPRVYCVLQREIMQRTKKYEFYILPNFENQPLSKSFQEQTTLLNLGGEYRAMITAKDKEREKNMQIFNSLLNDPFKYNETQKKRIKTQIKDKLHEIEQTREIAKSDFTDQDNLTLQAIYEDASISDSQKLRYYNRVLTDKSTPESCKTEALSLKGMLISNSFKLFIFNKITKL